MSEASFLTPDGNPDPVYPALFAAKFRVPVPGAVTDQDLPGTSGSSGSMPDEERQHLALILSQGGLEAVGVLALSFPPRMRNTTTDGRWLTRPEP